VPVCLNGDLSGYHHFRSNFDAARSGLEFQENSAKCIDIGLLNNMPDGALVSTERQFLTLLDAAAGGILVRLSLYALPDVPRCDSGRAHIRSFYSGIENLANRHLDGIIVTGTEPRVSNLIDEPYWGSMTGVLDWAEYNTYSTVWSCLAAHAAVLYMDGIARRRLDDKRFGLFECTPVDGHRLTAGIPSPVVMPHSRWNDLPEKELLDAGYRVLMRSKDAGVDTFVKRRRNLFVFFQGHPEYEANTLLLEYRRDIGRYLRRERDTYPTPPNGYFDREARDILARVHKHALRDRRPEILADFPVSQIEENLAKPWDTSAVRIYRNWLTYLCAQKERRMTQRQLPKAVGTNDIGQRRRATAV
jgi:homoserine O-succinyltransferase/O-acetyltransferase